MVTQPMSLPGRLVLLFGASCGDGLEPAGLLLPLLAVSGEGLSEGTSPARSKETEFFVAPKTESSIVVVLVSNPSSLSGIKL